MTTKTFTVAGITTHRGTNASGQTAERTKVRYGTDQIRLVKMLNSPKKIWNKELGVCLAPTRVDLIELPQAMTKAEALAHLAQAPEFQSADDQYVIQEAQIVVSKKARTAEKRIRAAAPSLEAIRSRGIKDAV